MSHPTPTELARLSELARLLVQLQSLKNALTTLESGNAELREETANIRAGTASLENRTTDLMSSNADLEARNAELRNTISDMDNQASLEESNTDAQAEDMQFEEDTTGDIYEMYLASPSNSVQAQYPPRTSSLNPLKSRDLPRAGEQMEEQKGKEKGKEKKSSATRSEEEEEEVTSPYKLD